MSRSNTKVLVCHRCGSEIHLTEDYEVRKNYFEDLEGAEDNELTEVEEIMKNEIKQLTCEHLGLKLTFGNFCAVKTSKSGSTSSNSLLSSCCWFGNRWL